MPKVDLSIWKGAPRVGTPFVGFIPMKAPIETKGIVLDEEDEFTVSMFMDRQNLAGRSVGLCIDLTSLQPSVNQLYDTAEWSRDWDVEYLSLPCAPPLSEAEPGTEWRESVPSEEIVSQFIAAVERFWASPANGRRHIAVHCVTGVNVAGYMIARFGMRVAPLDRVLGAIAASRPPGVYAPEFLEALWEHAPASSVADSWVQPQPPAWHPIVFRTIALPQRKPPAAPASAPLASAPAPSSTTAMPPPPPRSVAAPSATATMAPPSAKVKPAVPLFHALAADTAPRSTPASSSSLDASPFAAQMAGGPTAAPKRPPPTACAIDSEAPPTKKAALEVAGSDAGPGAGVGPLALCSVGRALSPEEAAALHRTCEELVGGGSNGSGGVDASGARAEASCRRLPCRSHGVSLRREHLQAMQTSGGSGMLVTWKASGERVLLLVLADASSETQTRSVLFDDRGGAWQLPPMHWPRLPSSAAVAREGSMGGAGGSEGTHAGLVLAGEVVGDKEGEGGSTTWRLLAYDVLAIHGNSTCNQPLKKRLALLNTDVLPPRKASPAVATERLRVRAKDCFRLKYVPYLLDKFLAKVTHPIRGLIFLKDDACHAPGTSESAGLDWLLEPPAGQATNAVPQAELVALAEAHFK